jgi:UPF0755 protein
MPEGDPGRRAAIVLAGAGTILVLLAAAGYAAWHDLHTPWLGWEGSEVFVEVEMGDPAGRIAGRLEEAGVVPSALLLRLYLRATGQGGDLKAGEYRFSTPLSPVEVVAKIVRGEVHLYQLTVPEGLDLAEMEALLAASGYWSAGDVARALARVDLVRDLAPEAESLEGYLFPETYSFPRSAGADAFVAGMVDRFRQVFGPDLVEAARGRGLSVHEAVTLASLVEEEVRLAEEAPLVASVIHNRIDRDMRLEIDASVIYALRREGKYDPPLTRRDLAFASPWNTYQEAGLPPGPIAAPGSAALEAAVRPATTDYLYYVLIPEGGGAHQFSKTYREHLRGVRRLHQSRR